MRAATIGEVLELFDRWGGDAYDEEVSQLAHALQTAALAEAGGASDALVAAALLHDVGHLLHLRDGGDQQRIPSVDLYHETVGAAWLADLLPVTVTGPIVLHVRAKRYRCAVDPEYFGLLSHGSVRSLDRQGGRMSDDEVAQFERLPGQEEAVQLRGWDDTAKVDGLHVPPLVHYVPLLEALTAS